MLNNFKDILDMEPAQQGDGQITTEQHLEKDKLRREDGCFKDIQEVNN